MLEWSLVLMVGGNEGFVDKDKIKTLNIERKTLKKETGLACFICLGCGLATQIAQKNGSSGVIIIIIIILARTANQFDSKFVQDD